jgi:hypothetical protein
MEQKLPIVKKIVLQIQRKIIEKGIQKWGIFL